MKTSSFETSFENGLSRFPALASSIIMIAGALVLVGWTLDIRAFIRLLPAMVTMNPVTAFTFVLAGLSLWCLGGRHKHSTDELRKIGLGLASLVLLVGILKVLDYLIPLDFHVDRFLFPRKLSEVGRYPPSEMAPNTALNFVLCGLSLLCFQTGRRGGFCPSQLLILMAGMIAVLALIGYSYRVLVLYRMGTTLPMSLDTALAFTLFCLGFLAAQSKHGFMLVITSQTSGGAMARRLLPTAILVPWVLGAVLLMFEQGGYFGRESAISLFAVASILTFSGLIWWNARLLYLNDIARVRAEQRLAAQYNSTRLLAESSNLSEAMPGILKTIGEGLGWQVGAFWVADPQSNTLGCAEVWQASAPADNGFLEATRSTVLKKGEGLPGRAWSQAKPVWSQDVLQEPNPFRTEAAAKAGLHGGIGFPLFFEKELFGVLEFFNGQREQKNEAALEMLANIGTQLGLFIERTRAEQQLRQTSANLQRSNTDLQQFAYVASHDLFEPLRMITGYLQLLSQKYSSKLDDEAQEFIHFAVDGARRMDALIRDLLAYARVEIRGRAFEAIDCEEVFDAALANLKVAIEETGAVVVHDVLPQVLGDGVQLTQVFQNLIGNAIKFRSPQPPRIEVHARRTEGEWLFSVRDNGIGIEPKHFERIFVIFQRLHTREQYAGTGLGLAICKRVIERHGGRIWVESSPGAGSCFFFTLPVIPEGESARNPAIH